MHDISKQISNLDTALFKTVVSQATDGDRQSLLALQAATADFKGQYAYLEIGSYLGGSLQPYVVDDRCTKIFSVDPRPRSLPDVRGTLRYVQNTTENMFKQLGKVPGANLNKITTFEEGTDTLDPKNVAPTPDLCLIDGEHTDAAVIRDSRFCLTVLNGHGCIAYHDANIVYNGILKFTEELAKSGHPFRAFNLLDSVFAIEVGDCRISDMPVLQQLRQNSYKGYLWSLGSNDAYRTFYYRPVFQFCRRLKAKTWNPIARGGHSDGSK